MYSEKQPTKYFIYFSYCGSAYCGWQVQPNATSVQEVLTQALRTILREKIHIVAAGRTDAGVHAKEMVAHFEVNDKIDNSQILVYKLNSLLPKDIAISEIRKVNHDAHARFDAIARAYEYHIIDKKNVFLEPYAMRIHQKLDIARMNQAATTLFDYTDFTSFSKLHTDVKTNNCLIKYAHWEEKDGRLIFTIIANRFLRNMVRAIVGTLIEVGMKKITIQDFKHIIEAKNRCKAGSSVPAKGLFLTKVTYPDNIFTE